MVVISYRPNQLIFPKEVYPDANFLISFYVQKHQWHNKASTLLTELVSKNVEINISLLTMDEALYTLMYIFYEDKKGKGSWKKDNPLKKNPKICVQFHPELDKFVKKLWKLPGIKFIDIPKPAFDILCGLLSNMSNEYLGPRDAFHLAIIKELGLNMILTNDSDFDKVNDNSIRVLHFW